MKVLQINSVCGIRSTGRISTDIAEILETLGHKSKIAYGREIVPEKHQKYAVRIGSSIDVKWHGFSSRIFDNTGFSGKKATKEFIKWAKEWNPDIIHLHNIHGYYINIESLFDYLKEANKPVVWTFHDCWPFTGHCAYFDYVSCLKWKTGCESCPQKSSYPKSITDNSKNNYEKKKKIFSGIENMTIVTPSQWLSGIVKESFLGSYNVKVINNGIDLGVFKPTEGDFKSDNNLIDKKIVLGVASVWEKRKGLEDFIKLSSMLEDSYKIVLVGLTKEQMKEIPKNVIGIERTNNTEELAHLYSAADVFVNPTYEDNFPTTNIEAMACGTPVITYKTGGSPEPISENCGYVVDKGDIAGLAEAISRMKDKEEYKEFCLKNSKNYDAKARYMDYCKLYEDMLKEQDK